MEGNNIQTLIVKNAQAGEKKAMEQIIASYNDQIFRMVFYRINSWTDAQDLTQETFIKAFRNIKRLKKAEKLKSWLYSIALNLVKDFYRKKKLLSFFGQAADLEKMTEYNPYSENKPSLIKAKEFGEEIKQKYLRFLSKNEKQIFMLKYIDDLTIHEIAETLNKNENTVKTHLYRSIKKIKKHREKIR
ncbi:MAG: RNA polymerase sigma factor [Desulfobacteraceae bacterium]|nr:RNA polymerase sigma factor [Desulfobacteraceae bacterium]